MLISTLNDAGTLAVLGLFVNTQAFQLLKSPMPFTAAVSLLASKASPLLSI